MLVIHRIRNACRGLIQLRGTGLMKRWLWNSEFRNGAWQCIDNTKDDRIYRFIEKYCDGGSILDLGCGAGNTGNEMDDTVYEYYLGVDLSDVALEKARVRSERNGRGHKNQYRRSAIEDFRPSDKYDIILFRESVFYIPLGRLKPTLTRYCSFLKPHGVFIVRLCDRHAYGAFVSMIEKNFDVMETYVFSESNAIILVFRSR